MSAESCPLTLTIPSDLRLITVARMFVESVCQVGGLDEGTTSAIVLATNEAVSNVIRHAHHELGDAQLQVQCRFRPDGLEITLLDEGAPFNLDAVPHLNPAEIRVGGRGVFLMRTLMDELTCQPRGERGNTLRMVKLCPRHSSARDCG